MRPFILLSLAGSMVPVLANAQTADTPDQAERVSEANGLGEIVVTAQRRSESAQRAAISINTVSASEIQRASLTSADQLTQIVPALRVLPGQGPYANMTVRGITNFGANSFADGAILMSVSGVPLAHPISSNGLFYDLDRVEVLKGPQGTLYGRNATGGAVNLVARQPDFDWGGSASLEIGNYDRRVGNFAINAPLGERTVVRLALQRVKRDGYFTDGTGDEDTIAARASLRFEPSDTVRFLVIADISKDKGLGTGTSLVTSRVNPPLGNSTGAVQSTFGSYVGLFDPVAGSQFTAAGSAPRNFLPFQNNRFKGVTLKAEVDAGIGTITVQPAYREFDLEFTSSMPSFYVGEKTHSRQYSIEARLASNAASRLSYVLGAFYLNDAVAGQQVVEVPPNISNQIIGTSTKSAAAFGQLTYTVESGLRLVAGVRYTKEDKATKNLRYRIPANFAVTPIFPFPAANAGVLNLMMNENRSFHSTTWKAGVEWDVAQDSLVYGNVSTGFKAGGFYLGPPGSNSYNPERVTAYTIGTKNRFFHRTLLLNVEGFYLKYKGQQISYQGFTSAGTSFVTSNVGKSTIYGIEADLQWRATPTTTIGANVQWERGKYDEFSYISANPVANTQTCGSTTLVGAVGFRLDCSGKRVLQLPEWIVVGSIEQRVPLANDAELVINASSRYETARETALSYLIETRAASYTRTNLSAAYHNQGDRWNVSAYVHNLENKAVVVQVQPGRAYTVSNGGLLTATYQAPRTYGVRFGINF